MNPVKMGLMAVVVAAAAAVAVAVNVEIDRPWLAPALKGDPDAQADALIAKMQLDEKIAMLHGIRNGYVGNVAGNSRLGIPPLNLNDGPQGFRDGGSTAWPSGMTVGQTWDRELAGAWGTAMGAEFFGKGANVQLGPGLCVARVPLNGRNFEYLSGEDPFLGYTLVQPVIKGIQGQNVIANAKHYIMNNQETKRNSINEVVDERTRFEMYYPPFVGASEAEVGSVMCSYNKINGFWSCENPETLQLDFKERIGFKGWVMSDWGATHSTSINQGLDQEMPGSGHMNPVQLGAALKSGSVTLAKIDDSVHRILMPMFKFGIFDTASHWSNASLHKQDVTSKNHSLVARQISAASSIVLKNMPGKAVGAAGPGAGDVPPLPLKPGAKIVVIGTDAKNPRVTGGGSGHVSPTYVIDPYSAIAARNAGNAPGPPPPPMQCAFLNDTDFYHLGDRRVDAESPGDCCSKCYSHEGCVAFTFTGGWDHEADAAAEAEPAWPEGHVGPLEGRFDYQDRAAAGTCWLHTSMGVKRSTKGLVSGTCGKAPAPPSGVTYDDGSSLTSAAAAAAAANVAVVFVSTSSSEGSDRKSLSFDGNADALVAAVVQAQPNTIVVGIQPGAVLMPWSEQVAGIVLVGMPGLEFGHGLADVLFGDVNPSGRLSLTMPNVENEVNFTQANWPGVDGNSTYSERLNVGYRYYDHHNISFTTGYPFGHGLSYTSFEYSGLQVTGQTVTVEVANTGAVAGAEVAQLYLEFPSVAAEPPLQLKGFEKVMIPAGGKTTVTFELTDRDLSIWDPQAHGWCKVTGSFAAHVGGSSRDLRVAGTIAATGNGPCATE